MSARTLFLGMVAAAAVFSPAQAAPAPTAPTVDCDGSSWGLSVDNYNSAKTDEGLKTFWYGGKGLDGYTYTPKTVKNNFFTKALALTVLPKGYDFDCTLETHSCNPAPECNDYGVLSASNQRLNPSHWGWFAVHSIANVYSFAESFLQAFTAAGTSASFVSLDLTKTFTKPSKNQDILTQDILIGFSFVAIAAFILLPVAGPLLGAAAGTAAGTALSAAGATGVVTGIAAGDAGSYLSNALSSSGADLDTKAANFGAFMDTVFDKTYAGIDSLVSNLMEGVALNGKVGDTPTIMNVIHGGGWVNSDVVTNPAVSLSEIRALLEKDLLQRGINEIWRQSKIWVTFADLQDDAQTTKCLADKNGWQASKTCADGGVYYLYRFNEDGNEDGHMSYPWGADQMTASPWNLDPAWVTRSSAHSYRAQNKGSGGFAYDYSKGPTNLPNLLQAVGQKGGLDNLNALEGVWNISVCDMGPHPEWNTDFTQSTQTSLWKDFSFPCCCGPQCSQQEAFIQSAQMNNFDTIYNKCKSNQLASCDSWAAGATESVFGSSGVVQKPSTC